MQGGQFGICKFLRGAGTLLKWFSRGGGALEGSGGGHLPPLQPPV